MPAAKILSLVAVSDLLVGVVLAVVGLSSDNQVLTIVGAALLLSGGAVLAWVVSQRNKPQAL